MLMSSPVVSGNVPCGSSGFLGQGFHRILQVLKQIEIYINPNSCRTLCCNNINNVNNYTRNNSKTFWLNLDPHAKQMVKKRNSADWFVFGVFTIQ